MYLVLVYGTVVFESDDWLVACAYAHCCASMSKGKATVTPAATFHRT